MKELKVGQKATVKVKLSSIRTLSFSCDVAFIEKDRIGLDFPENEMDKAYYLPEEREIDVLLYTQHGVRVLKSIVIDSPLEGNLVVEYYEGDSPIQRRMYVRVPTQLELILKKGDKKIITKTINISGGGIRFFVNQELRISDKWDFELFLPDWPLPITGDGHIIYMVRQQDNSMYSVIMFENILEIERNKIIKTCFDMEAKNMKLVMRQ